MGDSQAGQLRDPEIVDFSEQLESLLLETRALTDGLSREQFNWRPSEARWSIGQCLEHVTLTAQRYPDEIERMIEVARSRAAAGERGYREGWIASWIISSMEPPPKMRIRTSRWATPPADLSPDVVVPAFIAVHERLRDLLARADGTSLRHARMRSPFASFLWFTLRQTFAVNLAHARRHLWQARQVAKDARFPSPSSSGDHEPARQAEPVRG